jgi:carbon monoxide dehydrogenase subunit G
MKLKQEFEVAHAHTDVWEFFKDIPAVAACLPGAEYNGQDQDGKHKGKMSMKVGPFQTSFEGVAEVTYDDTAYLINMAGKGVDKKGSSRGKMTMVCQLSENGTSTNISVDAVVQLSGSIAQIGRTGIIEEIAGVLVADFVRNAEAALSVSDDANQDDERGIIPPSVETSPASAPISGFGLMFRALKAWLRTLLGSR